MGSSTLGRRVSTFVTNQHQRDIRQKKLSNGFYDHLERNEGHEINWEKVRFLDKEKNWKGRKIKEAIYINAVVPTSLMNERKLMNLEKGLTWIRSGVSLTQSLGF